MKLVDKDEHRRAHTTSEAKPPEDQEAVDNELARIRCHSIYAVFSADCTGFEREFQALQSVFEHSTKSASVDDMSQDDNNIADDKKPLFKRIFS